MTGRAATERSHDFAHRGIKATLYFAKELLPSITKKDAERAVRPCELCASISPQLIRTGTGHLDVEGVWDRVEADVTHQENKKFLTIIDCGPSRYSAWKRIKTEDAKTIAEGLEETFRMFGPPGEAIFDNGLSFRSSTVRQICDKWWVQIHFRRADRASGNAIVERCHKTVKEMAAKRGGDLLDAVALYNLTPRGDAWRSPAELMTGRKWNNPMLRQQPERTIEWNETTRTGPFQVGDAVWVKPPRSRCTDPWREGQVT